MHILNEMVSPTTSASNSPSGTGGSPFFAPTSAPAAAAGGLNPLELLLMQTPVVPGGDSESMLEDLVEIINSESLFFPEASPASASAYAYAPSGQQTGGLMYAQMFTPMSTPATYAPLETPVPSTATKNPWAFPTGSEPLPLPQPLPVTSASVFPSTASTSFECSRSLQRAMPIEQLSQNYTGCEDVVSDESGLVSRQRSTSWSFLSSSAPPTTAPTPMPSCFSSAPQSTAPSDCNEFDEMDSSEDTSGGSRSFEADIEEVRRRRNNESSRRSRAKRKSRERSVFDELRQTEKRNAELRARIARAKQLYESMQETLVHCIKDGNARP